MSGLFTFSAAGVGFLVLAAVEIFSPRPLLRFASAAALSSLFILSSLVSSISSLSSPNDPVGAPLPLSTAAVAALFLLYSLAGIASRRSPLLLPFPPSLLDLIQLAAFTQELLLLSLRRKDTDGIENRYLDLLLVPTLVCATSALAALAKPQSSAPRLARAAGLALHGTWLIQMAFSFFSTAMAHGCWLHRSSRANFTIKCKGHPEYHRARAIATLQFNCHLALIVVVGVGLYLVIVSRGYAAGGGYRPLNKELQRMEHVSSQFTLDSDEEEQEIAVEANALKQQHDVVLSVPETNGFGGSH